MKHYCVVNQTIEKLTIEKGASVKVKNQYHVNSGNTGYDQLSGALFIGDASLSSTDTALVIQAGDGTYAGGLLYLQNNDLIVYPHSSNQSAELQQ